MATALAGAVAAGFPAPASAAYSPCDEQVEFSCYIAHCSYDHCYLQLCAVYVAPRCVV